MGPYRADLMPFGLLIAAFFYFRHNIRGVRRLVAYLAFSSANGTVSDNIA